MNKIAKAQPIITIVKIALMQLKNESELGTLEELTKIKNFNSKVIVLLSKDKEHLKKYYIKDGFTDVILKENLTDDIDAKMKENL